jgi:hypothetical protein
LVSKGQLQALNKSTAFIKEVKRFNHKLFALSNKQLFKSRNRLLLDNASTQHAPDDAVGWLQFGDLLRLRYKGAVYPTEGIGTVVRLMR